MTDWDEEELFSSPPLGRVIYDAVLLLFLMLPAVLGSVFFGSTRLWALTPGLFSIFIAGCLCALRPYCFRDFSVAVFPRWLILVAVLLFYVGIRVPFSAVPYAARLDALRVFSAAVSLWTWIQIGMPRDRWKWLLILLLFFITLNGWYALIQHVNGSRLVLWITRPDQYAMRVSGTYICPNHFANLLAMAIPLGVAFLLMPFAGLTLRAIALYTFIVLLPALYLSESRSAWLGTLGGVATTGLLLIFRWNKRLFLLALILAPFLFAGIGFVAWKTLPTVQRRFEPVLHDADFGGAGRIESWRDSIPMIKNAPAFGHGGGSFVWKFPPYQKHTRTKLLYDYLHNEYIQWQVEYGVVGIVVMGILIVALAGSVIWVILRTRSTTVAALFAGASGSVAACLIHALFDFNFHIFANVNVLMWIVGVTWGAYENEKWQSAAPLLKRAKIGRGILSSAVLFLCVLCGLVSAKLGLSYWNRYHGDSSRMHSEWAPAEAQYAKSIAWDSGNWRPYLGMGNIEAARAFWKINDAAGREQHAQNAFNWFARAKERNPYDMEIYFGEARMLKLLQRQEEALEKYEFMAAQMPKHVFYQEKLGLYLEEIGRLDDALAHFQSMVENKTTSDITHLKIRLLKRKIQKRDSAAAAPQNPST